jgi:hypothetical protein
MNYWTALNDIILTNPQILQLTTDELSQSQSYFTTGGLPPISSSRRRAPWDSRPEPFFLSQLNTCGLSTYITSSVMRGGVCHLQLLLVLASACCVLGSESRGTRDHILLSQIRDFPFLSPPTTRRATVEVFDPTSTWEDCQRQSYFTTGGLPPVSLSWLQDPWDPRPEIISPQLNPCDVSPYVTSSLTRRWDCLLWICLAFRQVYISHI